MTVPRRILPVIVLSQFAGTSLWFAANAVMADLQRAWNLPNAALGQITNAVQLGFILGTLVFAILAIADRYSPRIIFFACALAGAACTAAVGLIDKSLSQLLILRFLTGFFLAGIYPVGMKIASGWYVSDLGKALGFLVGALVLGTAFPHLVRGLGQSLPWQSVLLSVSVLAALGGAAMWACVPDGPRLKASAKFDPQALAEIFRSPQFRASSFGYFGHMWEVYAFWAYLPLVLGAYLTVHAQSGLNVSLWTFTVIASGALGCIGGGYISQRLGSAKVASTQLLTSGVCCLVSPLMFAAPLPLYLAFLIVWGIVVVGDSPQFSALNAQYAPADRVGSALTIGNSIGFAITIVSIQLLSAIFDVVGPRFVFLVLIPGPALGLLALRRLAA
jgi:MFS family permease